MRTKFRGYYPYKMEDYETVWAESVIVLDANILLNLYRYGQETRNTFLKVLEEYKERLWIPYNIGEEFFRNRINVIMEKDNTYKSFKKSIYEPLDKIEILIAQENSKTERKTITNLDAINKKICDLKTEIEKGETEYEQIWGNDIIIEKILELYDQKVGEKHNEEDLQKLYKEIDSRYKNKIAPGFEDANKEGNTKYGDCINWFDMIDYAKNNNKHIIFITDDTKKDWFFEYKGEKNPNPELLFEFYQKTNKMICIYRPTQFLKYVSENEPNITVNATVINDVESTTKENEISVSIDTTPELYEKQYQDYLNTILINNYIEQLNEYRTNKIIKAVIEKCIRGKKEEKEINNTENVFNDELSSCVLDDIYVVEKNDTQ